MSDFSPDSIQGTYREERMKAYLCLKQKWQEIIFKHLFPLFFLST